MYSAQQDLQRADQTGEELRITELEEQRLREQRLREMRQGTREQIRRLYEQNVQLRNSIAAKEKNLNLLGI